MGNVGSVKSLLLDIGKQNLSANSPAFCKRCWTLNFVMSTNVGWYWYYHHDLAMVGHKEADLNW